MKKIKFKQIRSSVLEYITQRIALPMIDKYQLKYRFPYTMNDLLKMPANSLGNDLALYLQKKNFRLINNYASHDFKHIILNYEMEEVDEARMQFYFLGNRHYSSTVLITVFVCFFLMPEHWKQFYIDFKRGRKNPSMKNIDFTKLVFMSTAEIQQQFT